MSLKGYQYRQRLIDRGEVPPMARRLLNLLLGANGGMVTIELIEYQLWKRLGRPASADMLAVCLRDIRSIGHVVQCCRAQRGLMAIGYRLVA